MLYTLERISAYWPATVVPFRIRLLEQLAKAAGDPLAMALETLQRGEAHLPGLLADVMPDVRRGRLLGNLNVAVQRNTLALLATLLPDLLEDRSGGSLGLGIICRVKTLIVRMRIHMSNLESVQYSCERSPLLEPTQTPTGAVGDLAAATTADARPADVKL